MRQSGRSPVAFARVQGYVVPPARVYRTRRHEVFVQVIDEFKNVTFHGSRYGDVVNQAVREGNSVISDQGIEDIDINRLTSGE